MMSLLFESWSFCCCNWMVSCKRVFIAATFASTSQWLRNDGPRRLDWPENLHLKRESFHHSCLQLSIQIFINFRHLSKIHSLDLQKRKDVVGLWQALTWLHQKWRWQSEIDLPHVKHCSVFPCSTLLSLCDWCSFGSVPPRQKVANGRQAANGVAVFLENHRGGCIAWQSWAAAVARLQLQGRKGNISRPCLAPAWSCTCLMGMATKSLTAEHQACMRGWVQPVQPSWRMSQVVPLAAQWVGKWICCRWVRTWNRSWRIHTS